MSDAVDERLKLVEAIMRHAQQPTLSDAVAVHKFDSLQSVVALLELDGKLRKMYWERRDTWPSEY